MSSSSSVVKSSSSVSSSSKTSNSSVSTSHSHSSMSYKTQSNKKVISSGAEGSGMDMDLEIAKMQQKLDAQMSRMKAEMMSLMPGSGGELIRLDNKAIQQYIDTSNKDVMNMDFDVHEFQSETITVKSNGNKVEVHAKKQVKKGDQEHSEEYSRTYELPSGVDAQKVTSSIKEGGNVLTIQLPVNQAQIQI